MRDAFEKPEYRRAVEAKRDGKRIDPDGLTLHELVEAHVEAWGGPVGADYFPSSIDDFMQAAAQTLEAERLAGDAPEPPALDDSLHRLVAAFIARRVAEGADPDEVVGGIVMAAQDAERDCRQPDRRAA